MEERIDKFMEAFRYKSSLYVNLNIAFAEHMTVCGNYRLHISENGIFFLQIRAGKSYIAFLGWNPEDDKDYKIENEIYDILKRHGFDGGIIQNWNLG